MQSDASDIQKNATENTAQNTAQNTPGGGKRSSVALAISVAGAAGLGLTALRLAQQKSALGEMAIYSAADRTFYVPHEILGWESIAEGWFWLGLDLGGAAIVAAIASVLLAMGVARRLKSEKGRMVALSMAAVAALVSLAIPAYAISTGLPPEHALGAAPELGTEVATDKQSFAIGEEGDFSVVEGELSEAVAKVTAGGETFDTKFPDLTGNVHAVPVRLGESFSATFVLGLASVDTGIELRSSHARDYLKAEEFKTITVDIPGLTQWGRESENKVSFEAEATLTLMGDTMPVTVSGTAQMITEGDLDQIDAKTGDILVRAQFALDLNQTPLKSDAESFDDMKVPLQIRALLRRSEPPKK